MKTVSMAAKRKYFITLEQKKFREEILGSRQRKQKPKLIGLY